ncbi:hypothetical protein [Amycolatopsis sp. NPDC098790]|uniref:hypothetical protein n=1 Tax=Amycolatopsis sp. NPDC098790 TaxID=3363939 RepID=UPI00380574C6
MLAVPLALNSTPRSGIPALAIDVWTAHELRRAGFEPDSVWPRAAHPRVLPSTFTALLKEATKTQEHALLNMMENKKTYGGEMSASANILGKNYVKQVDVVISAWNTGPELMISTKRMDSSFGNNAANRVEESYGDAKNLRGRHPQAALGFIYSLNQVAFEPKYRRIADWIVDLLGKLGREDDAYDAVALIVPDRTADAREIADDEIDDEKPLVSAGIEPTLDDEENVPADVGEAEIDEKIDQLPQVALRTDIVPNSLSPERFFKIMINRVLDNCPVNFHERARELRAHPVTVT